MISGTPILSYVKQVSIYKNEENPKETPTERLKRYRGLIKKKEKELNVIKTRIKDSNPSKNVEQLISDAEIRVLDMNEKESNFYTVTDSKIIHIIKTLYAQFLCLKVIHKGEKDINKIFLDISFYKLIVSELKSGHYGNNMKNETKNLRC